MANTATNKIKKNKFLEAFKEMDTSKGVDTDTLMSALKESFRVTFAKKIEDEYKIDKKLFRVGQAANKDKTAVKLPDALIRVDIDPNKATIKCYRQFLVVNDDDVNDDYIEIGLTEAKEKNPKLALGDYYEEELSLDTLDVKDISRLKSTFTQKINKAEKDSLLSTFANKIGTIVTGVVEKSDPHSVIVELGRTTATLTSRDLIGDEKFAQGEPIKVYVEGIGKDDKKGSLVKISRSCNGYLRELFVNEIHEIYDGTVEIKYVERIPGRRAKVCVYSNDPNVDPSGACIGEKGNRIQSIVSALGNAKDNKEKIDVVTWNPNLGLFVSELLRPGKVLGMVIDDDAKKITVVTDDETLNLAIGFRGSNVILAKRITGYDIKVIDESQANEENLTYKTMDQYEVEAKEDERKRFREKQQEAIKSRESTPVKEEAEEDLLSKEGDEVNDETEVVVEEAKPEEVKSEETPVASTETKAEEKVENNEEIKPVEPVVEPKKVKEEEPIEFKEVKTTTTLESLEKSLEEEKKEKASSKKSFKKKKKDIKKSDDEDEEKEEKKAVQKMDIYTDEELEAFENEDADDDYDEDEEDYSEYDDDDYYEDR